MPLTIAQARSAKPKQKDRKLFDERGLYLLIKKNGAKYWRLKYYLHKKEKLLALGVFPEVSLQEARDARDDVRYKLRQGVDPAVNNSGTTFIEASKKWRKTLASMTKDSEDRIDSILEKDLYPEIGTVNIANIKASEWLRVIKKIEKRGAIETAKRANQYGGRIFRFAIASDICENDPSQVILDALAVQTSGNFAAITDPDELGVLLKAIDNYPGTAIVHYGLKILPLLFCRPGELRHLEWKEVKTDRIEISAEKMKMDNAHIIPLSRQAKEILDELRKLKMKTCDYVFYSARRDGRPMSENALVVALKTMGYSVTAHGFRATARTLLDEELDYPVDWIEHQLAHQVKDVNGRSYNRTKHLKQRTGMMQGWADYLDGLKNQ